MLEAFLKYIQQEQLTTRNVPVVAAVSGGVDSMVLARLLSEGNFNFAIAHCNFGLRGAESDADQIFVQAVGETYGVEVHTKFFDTESYALDKGLSIQMAARELRFEWFDLLCVEHGYEHIALGTHLSDSVETFFINLIRGTGIAGLSGIRPKRDRIIRPLLFATNDMIRSYAEDAGVSWREDSSNADDKYRRNFIRHHIVPKLKELNPGFEEVMRDNMKRLSQVENHVGVRMQLAEKQVVGTKSGRTYLDKAELEKLIDPKLFLYGFLGKMGFNAVQVDDIYESRDAQAGKRFIAGDKTLLNDRDRFWIYDTEEVSRPEAIIKKGTPHIESPINLSFSTIPMDEFELSTDSRIAALNADKLTFPLTLRKWALGDTFVPLGMRGKKKVSDLLIDLKIPVAEKQNVYVLVSGEEIVWVVGYRISNRYRVDKVTKMVYLVEAEGANTL